MEDLLMNDELFRKNSTLINLLEFSFFQNDLFVTDKTHLDGINRIYGTNGMVLNA